MRRSTSCRLLRSVVVASAAVLALSTVGGQAAAAPTEQDLADYIAAGR
ncbi:lipase, partial [Nocardia cyriacigeorgica]|nr:lipase [Nocardia cyriacigeorgica]